jgi:hypothetical protein
MENSPWVLMKWMSSTIIRRRYEAAGFPENNLIGPWLRPLMEDGKLSSASIREGLGLEIKFDCFKDGTSGWYAVINTGKGIGACAELEYINLHLTDPAADELANQIGIIEYHKQFPKEVEDYLEGLK